MQDLIGHSEIQSFFKRVIANDQLSHAYLFVGPEHVGKRTMAEALAAELLKVEREKLSRHLDVHFVQQEENLKTGKTKKNIDVEQIRDVRDFVSRYAAMGGYKIIIIDEAEKMSAGASNALLKTLEEPTKKTILFLISSDEDAVLPTIRSRCQIIYFERVPDDILPAAYKRHAYGRPGLVATWLANPEIFSAYKAEWQRCEELIDAPFYRQLAAVDGLFGDGKDHIKTRGELTRTLDIWQLVMREHLITKPNQKWVQVIDQIERVKSLLQQNIHPRLAVEQVLLAMA